MERLRQEKLKWKCRRGLLELDIVLERYRLRYMEGIQDENENVNENENERLGQLMTLLDLPDNDLWDIISGRSDRFDAKFEGIVAQLRAV